MKRLYPALVSLLATLFRSPMALAASDENKLSGVGGEVAEKARLAVAQMNDRAAGGLDYSEASLQAVENMAREAAQYKDQLDQATIDSVTQLLGSYILEVAHRKYGGSYMWFDPQNAPLLVVGAPKYSIAIAPFDKVRGRIFGDEADNLIFFYQGFANEVKSARPGVQVLYN